MLLWLVFGAVTSWPNSAYGRYSVGGNWLMLFILLVLLGWKVFGAPLR